MRRGRVGLIGLLAAAGGLYGLWRSQHTLSSLKFVSPPAESLSQDLSPAVTGGLTESAAAPLGLAPSDEAAMTEFKAHFAAGDYGKTLEIAERQLGQADLDKGYLAWVRSQLGVVLTCQAWVLIKSGHCDEALPLLSRALRAEAIPEATKGLAICTMKSGLIDDAEKHFEAYLAREPKDREVRLIYSDLLESQGRFTEAAAMLQALLTEAGLPEGPGRTALDQRLKSMLARDRESGRQLLHATESYRLLYRAGEHESLVPAVTDALDQVLEEFRNQWGLTLPRAPIEVALYPNAGFTDLVAYGPRWASALYDGRIRVPVTQEFIAGRNVEALVRILRHEMFHGFVAEQVDRRQLPPWFNEGVAQQVECPDGCSFPGFPPIPGNFFAAADFMRPFTNLDKAHAEQIYKQSLYMVRVLGAWPGIENPIRSVLENLNQSTPLDADGILRPLGITFNQLRDRSADLWNSRFRP